MMREKLEKLGWRADFERRLEGHDAGSAFPVRVISISRDTCALAGEAGELKGVLSGKFYQDDKSLPVVGDWVLVRATGDDGLSLVTELLPRRNFLSRKTPGKRAAEQVMAANIDVMFIVQDVLRLNVPLAERYLALAGGSGISPVIVLNKCDLDSNAADTVRDLAGRIPGRDIVALSALTGEGLDAIACRVPAGATACLLGPSGAGKSSIVNRLLGNERQRVARVRDDDLKGRHATTSRELFFLPGGGMIIDTPGMRELMPWDAAGLDESFGDIDALAAECRYTDCRHDSEPKCAVRKAAENGMLSPGRLENYLRLKREMAFLESRVDEKARMEKKRKDKELARLIRDYNRRRDDIK